MKPYRLTRIIFLLLFSMFSVARAQQKVEKVVTETQYLLYLPEGYSTDTARQWPVLLFLHGSGESGKDIEKVKKHGPPKLIEGGKKFPFIVVSPQSDVPSGWDIDQLYKLLQQVKRQYRVDASRIYLTGLSMGGYGTWALAMKYPDEFAAIAPVCGGGDTANAWKLRNIPVWNFHGALDNVVPLSGSRNMVAATSRYNPTVHFTVYPNKDHNSWDTTYNTSDTLYRWLLAQKKHVYKEVPVAPQTLQKYAGVYANAEGDTVRIMATKTGLVAMPGRDSVPLRPAGGNVFFIRADRNMDIRFTEEGRDKMSFVFLGERSLLFRRVRKN
jgi:dienelactone hydrolase